MSEQVLECPHQIEVPVRMRHMSIDPERPRFHVPWFVAWIDGKPDYRVIGPGKIVQAVKQDRCWLCGQRLGSTKAFVIGPMCAVNRVSSEPPSHVECAEYAVKICPFLSQPRMKRNDKDLPEQHTSAAGIPLQRNPGCALVWITDNYKPFRTPDGGVLFDVGEPRRVSWWAEGRLATREEIMASIDSGLPTLRKLAEDECPAAVRELEAKLDGAMRLVPAAA